MKQLLRPIFTLLIVLVLLNVSACSIFQGSNELDCEYDANNQKIVYSITGTEDKGEIKLDVHPAASQVKQSGSTSITFFKSNNVYEVDWEVEVFQDSEGKGKVIYTVNVSGGVFGDEVQTCTQDD